MSYTQHECDTKKIMTARKRRRIRRLKKRRKKKHLARLKMQIKRKWMEKKRRILKLQISLLITQF